MATEFAESGDAAYLEGYFARLDGEEYLSCHYFDKDPDGPGASDWSNGWMDADDDVAFGVVQ